MEILFFKALAIMVGVGVGAHVVLWCQTLINKIKNDMEEKRKRPVEFQNLNTRKVEKGLFHQFGTEISECRDNGLIPETVALVEDESGQIHFCNPETIQFLDR